MAKIIRLTFAITIFLESSLLFAGDFLFRAEGGFVRDRFTPDYTFQYQRPNEKYADIAHGAALTVGTGYRVPVSDGYSIDLVGQATFSSAVWKLSVDEPADFEYKIPAAIGVSVIPAIHLSSNVSIFGQAGLLQGQVKERKESPTSSRYDFSEWTTGYSVGGGLSYKIRDNLEVFGGYRYDGFREISYKSFLPDGTHRETITDSPRRMFVTAGLAFSF